MTCFSVMQGIPVVPSDHVRHVVDQVCHGECQPDIALTEDPRVTMAEINGAGNGNLNWITNFIWGIADDILRDLYVRGKYRDVILPLTVLRRLDAVLEPTKQDVLEMKASLDKATITNQDAALRQAAGLDFYNTSRFTLRDLSLI